MRICGAHALRLLRGVAVQATVARDTFPRSA
jgi:hypothetical protein